MRVLRASLIALFTAFVGCLLAFFLGDYLSRLAHMSNMEGGRGMFVVFVCAPLGILAGLVIGITKDPEHATVPGHVLLLTHSKTRSVLASIGNEPVASQFIELRIPPAPRKEDEAWSDWIFATQRADLNPVSEPERMALRYRVRPVND